MSTSDSSAMIAPCHRTSSWAPAGEPSSVIATASRPVSARPTAAASRTVALSMTTRGSAPRWWATRSRRRTTSAMCEPVTPRQWWASSMTMRRSDARKRDHRWCDGSIT